MLAQALRQFNDQLRKMLEKLINGQQLSQEELDRLSRHGWFESGGRPAIP